MPPRVRQRSVKPQPPDPAPDDAPCAVADAELETAVLRMTEDQMLVNQALVQKIFSCERSQATLRDSEQKLHDLLAHQRASRETERKQLSRDIHDSLGQNLLALRMDIVSLMQQTGSRHARLHGWVGAALDNVDFTLRTVRQLLSELRPAGFDLGIQATIEIEAASFSRTSGIVCELQVEPGIDGLGLDEETLMSVYRVLQEALNNIMRHSLASRVQLTLGHDGDMLTLAIRDNGIGFDTGAPHKSCSFGLAAQREQVVAHGGTLEVSSERAHGTRLALQLPICRTQGPSELV